MNCIRRLTRTAVPAGFTGLAVLLVVCCGCRSSRESPPLAFMFPTLYSTRILDTVAPVDVSAKQVAGILERLDIAAELRGAGMPDRELTVIARGLGNRGYAELDARRAPNGRVRWVSFRSEKVASGENPVLVVTVGYWSRPGDLSRFGIDTDAQQPVRNERRDPYGVPQIVGTWTGTGPESPVLRRVADAFSGDLSHWELEITGPLDVLSSPAS